MVRRKVIPNGSIMRWKLHRRLDEYADVRVLERVKRKKGEWQKYHVQRLDTGKTMVVQGNTLFDPVPKFNTIEEVEAWLESQ
jgi:hypothetical protein